METCAKERDVSKEKEKQKKKTKGFQMSLETQNTGSKTQKKIKC